MLASYKVVNGIEKLGLKGASHKTEAMIFPANVRRENKYINIRGTDIEVRTKMNYLGVVIDGGWNYRAHFDVVADKVEKTMGHLHRLMPNIRKPSEHKRRLCKCGLSYYTGHRCGGCLWGTGLLETG